MPQHREVGARILQHDLGLELALVGERDLDLAGALDDVVVGDDEAGGDRRSTPEPSERLLSAARATAVRRSSDRRSGGRTDHPSADCGSRPSRRPEMLTTAGAVRCTIGANDIRTSPGEPRQHARAPGPDAWGRRRAAARGQKPQKDRADEAVDRRAARHRVRIPVEANPNVRCSRYRPLRTGANERLGPRHRLYPRPEALDRSPLPASPEASRNRAETPKRSEQLARSCRAGRHGSRLARTAPG